MLKTKIKWIFGQAERNFLFYNFYNNNNNNTAKGFFLFIQKRRDFWNTL